MEIRVLRFFLSVCEEGSMSSAAKKLHVTQPALSRQISDLERELGCKLLMRESRGVVPTDQGLYLPAVPKKLCLWRIRQHRIFAITMK